MKPVMITRRFLTVLGVLVFTFAPYSLVSCNGTTSESETGKKIDLQGRVLDKDRMPYPGVQARLAKAGLADTTDALGRYFIRKDTAPLNAGSRVYLDTLDFLLDGKKVRFLEITRWIDSLVDVRIFPPEIISPSHSYARMVLVGDTVLFGIHSTGSPIPTFQWQLRSLNSATWSDIPGATSDSLALGSASFSDSGKSFRSIACNVLGCDTSHAAELHIVTSLDTIPPTIISPTDPYSRTVAAGDTVQFGIHATGSLILTFQWQLRSPDSAIWADIPGATSDNFALGSAALSDSGKSFRSIACNARGCDTSHAAELRVNP